MARFPKIDNYKLPDITRNILIKYHKLTSTLVYKHLVANNAPILTTDSDFKRWADILERKYHKYNLSVQYHSHMIGKPFSDMIFYYDKRGMPFIRIHPICHYYPKAYAKQILLHEMDHLDADIRNKICREGIGIKKIR